MKASSSCSLVRLSSTSTLTTSQPSPPVSCLDWKTETEGRGGWGWVMRERRGGSALSWKQKEIYYYYYAQRKMEQEENLNEHKGLFFITSYDPAADTVSSVSYTHFIRYPWLQLKQYNTPVLTYVSLQEGSNVFYITFQLDVLFASCCYTVLCSLGFVIPFKSMKEGWTADTCLFTM